MVNWLGEAPDLLGSIMTKKPDYQLEFVYKKSQFKKAMWVFLAIWVILRVFRAILYFTVGIAYLSSIPAALIFWASGVCFGFAILSIILYRRSIQVEEIEREKDRLTNKH
jgi:hypothetical protein